MRYSCAFRVTLIAATLMMSACTADEIAAVRGVAKRSTPKPVESVAGPALLVAATASVAPVLRVTPAATLIPSASPIVAVTPSPTPIPTPTPTPSQAQRLASILGVETVRRALVNAAMDRWTADGNDEKLKTKSGPDAQRIYAQQLSPSAVSGGQADLVNKLVVRAKAAGHGDEAFLAYIVLAVASESEGVSVVPGRFRQSRTVDARLYLGTENGSDCMSATNSTPVAEDIPWSIRYVFSWKDASGSIKTGGGYSAIPMPLPDGFSEVTSLVAVIDWDRQVGGGKYCGFGGQFCYGAEIPCEFRYFLP